MINGGNIAMLGIMPDETGIPLIDVVFKGLNIKGIYGREMYETLYKMVMMIQRIAHRGSSPTDSTPSFPL